MKNLKKYIALLIVVLTTSIAHGNATDDLLKAVQDKKTTAKQVLALIKFGADVNYKGKGTPPLIRAAYANGNPEVMKVLIDAGADVNIQTNDYGITALIGAVDREYSEIVKILIASGADVNLKDKRGNTAIFPLKVMCMKFSIQP